MPKKEAEFLYRPVSSSNVPGFVIDKIGDDIVSPPTAPFRDGFIPDFSRVVTSYRRSGLTPELVQVSPTHKRAFEMRYSPAGYIFWADESGNMFGTLQIKGGNLTNPDVRVEKRAPSGYIIWGIQDSDSILRTVRASRIMREHKIPTEAIVRLIEPTQLQYRDEVVTTDEFKKRLVQKVWDGNHRKSTRNEDGWHAVTRAEVPKLSAELKGMTFYLSTLGRQVSERFLDLKFASSPEALQQVMSRVLTFWNARNKWSEKKQIESPMEVLDGNKPEDILKFFTTYLPAEVAKNYAALHNLGLVHTYPHLGNVSLVGSIYDVDSVYGEPLGIGDEAVTEDQIMDDVQCIIAGTEGFQHADGIINLLKHLEDKEVFPRRSEVAKAFSQTFAIEYIKGRGWTNDVLSNIGNISRVLRLSDIYFFSEKDESTRAKIKEEFGQENYDLLTKYYLLRSYGFSHLHGKFPLIVDVANMPTSNIEVTEGAMPAELTAERKVEVVDFATQALTLHSQHLSTHPNSGEHYFSFPEASEGILGAHSRMKREDIVDLVRMWAEGDMSAVTQEFDPRVVGSFMLALGQLNIDNLYAGIKVATPTKEDPQLVEKLSRINEFFELLPGIARFRDYLMEIAGGWPEAYDLEKETEYRAGIALFGRGIITHGLHEIFNHYATDIIFNEFTSEQAQALREALECPDLVDPLMGKDNTTYLLRVGLTGVQVRAGQTEGLALLEAQETESMKQVISADLQYFFASEDKNQFAGSNLTEAMKVEISKGWCAGVLRQLIVSKKGLHPNSFFAQTLKDSSIEANDIADLLKTALDVNGGNLDGLDPNIKNILETKTYEGVISKDKAAELVWSCMGFGVDLPGILTSCLSEEENRTALMNFLSANKVHRDAGIYRGGRNYPNSPIYELMSKGAEALPPKLQELFIARSEDQTIIDTFATGIVDHLFNQGYLRFYFGGLINLENYPEPPIDMKDLLVRHPSGKVAGYAMWKIVNSDIWDILRLADPQVLNNTIKSRLDEEGKVFTEFTVFKGERKGWGGQRRAPLSDCLPADLYARISTIPS